LYGARASIILVIDRAATSNGQPHSGECCDVIRRIRIEHDKIRILASCQFALSCRIAESLHRCDGESGQDVAPIKCMAQQSIFFGRIEYVGLPDVGTE
jgi:hypothetical protein